jgi:hypothetical protein
VNAAVAQTPKPLQQDLRYYLPRWMAVFVAITLIPQLLMFSPGGRGVWYIPSLVVIGLWKGRSGGWCTLACSAGGIPNTADRDGFETICLRASLSALAACGR